MAQLHRLMERGADAVGRGGVKYARKRDGNAFVALPVILLHSPKLIGLSSRAVKLLVDLCAQYNGRNNGDLTCAFSVLRRRGWRSQTTLQAAKAELLVTGFIAETRKGKFPNQCALFGLTWFELDHCGGKLEISARSFPRGAWNKPDFVPLEPVRGAFVPPISGAAARQHAPHPGATSRRGASSAPVTASIGDSNSTA